MADQSQIIEQPKIILKSPVREEIVNFLTEEKYSLLGGKDMSFTDADFNRAEIGYWADEKCRGFMTNAVIKLASFAKQARFIKLFAGVRSDNTSSSKVLERAGFIRIGNKMDDDGTPNFVYEKRL